MRTLNKQSLLEKVGVMAPPLPVNFKYINLATAAGWQ
jgi:hypothetical protein